MMKELPIVLAAMLYCLSALGAEPSLLPTPDPISTPCHCDKHSKGADPKCSDSVGNKYDPPCEDDDPFGDCGKDCPNGIVCEHECPNQGKDCATCINKDDPEGAKICPACDHDDNENKEKWECHPCDFQLANGDPGQDGVNESCYVCDQTNDGIRDTCRYLSDPDGDGTLSDCYQEDTDGNGWPDSNCDDFRIAIEPSDNFNGRSLTKLGIGETGNFSIKSDTLPKDPFGNIDTSQVQVTWSASGGISVNGSGGVIGFTAGDDNANFTVSATINDCTTSFSGQIVRPTDIVHVRVPSYVKHIKGQPSVFIKLGMYYLPQDVSFWKVSFREIGGPAITTGYFEDLEENEDFIGDLYHDPLEGFTPVFKNTQTYSFDDSTPLDGFMQNFRNVDKSIDFAGYDFDPMLMTDGTFPPFSNGTWKWEIPYQFTTGNGEKNLSFKTIQLHTIDQTGKACVTKSKVGPVCKDLNDNTIGN